MKSLLANAASICVVAPAWCPSGAPLAGDGARGPSGVPNVTPTVDWVRMAQRFPVRITVANADPEHPLRKGMRATVRIDTTAGAGGR